MVLLFIHKELRPMNKKALRVGSHCVRDELCRGGDPPQAVNPVEQDSFFPLKKKGTVI